MADCPSLECHEKVMKHDRLLYAKDGLLVCLQKKVSWVAMGTITLALLGLLGTPIFYSLAAEKKQNEKISQIQVIKEQVKQIKKTTEKTDVKIDNLDNRMRLLEIKQMTPEQFKALMKSVLKEN